MYLQLPPPVNVHWVLQFLLQCLAPGPLSQELTLQVVQLTPGTNRQTDRQRGMCILAP